MMFLRIWRFVTIVLAALTMGTAFAHTLELPAKMNYNASLYTTISQSLYWGFGHIGGPIEGITVFLATPLLLFLVRKQRPTFWWTLAGTSCFALAFIVFLAFTEPMNREIFQWSITSGRLRQRVSTSRLDTSTEPVGILSRRPLCPSVDWAVCVRDLAAS